jgi:hypothetical protein
MGKRLRIASVVLALCASIPQAVSAAQLSIAGGGYVSGNPSQTGGAVLVSSAASVPAFPIQLQATVLIPVTSQGGYAVTGEVRGLSGGGFGGAYVGAGAGIGNLSLNHQGNGILTAFVGKPLAPFTTFELRVYKGLGSGGSTAGFVGLRFSF